MSKTVIVMGVARSGTSILAGMLHKLGVNMGNVKEKPIVGNPKGAFEDVHFIDATKVFHKAMRNAKIKHELKLKHAHLKKVIAQRNQQYPIWGFKAAGAFVVIDEFLKHIDNPYFVFIFRNPVDTILSNLNLWKYKRKQRFEKILMANLDILTRRYFRLKKKYPVIKTTYDKLRLAPIQEAEKISDFLGIKLTNNKIQKINHFIIPNYHSFKE